MASEKIYSTLDDDDKEPEMIDQREILASKLDIEIEQDN